MADYRNRPEAFHGWETPPEVFDALNAVFQFTLDAAAVSATAKCSRFICPTAENTSGPLDENRWDPYHGGLYANALETPWNGRDGKGDRRYEHVWLNPPYSAKTLGLWLKKAWEESDSGNLVACLIPANPGIAAWRDWVYEKAVGVMFRTERIDFLRDGIRNGRPNHASALVVYSLAPFNVSRAFKIRALQKPEHAKELELWKAL